MKIVGIIPSRYHSSRFEGKPLADICGKPMIWWVYSGVKKSKKIEQVYVATDDERIEKCCNNYNIPVIMTSSEHRTPNDRVYEAAQKLEADIYVVVLGDEPLISGDAVDAVLPENMDLVSLYVTNLVSEIKNPVEVVDCTNNKIVTNLKNEIVYASRTPIPYPKGSMSIKYRKILGISAMSKDALEFYHRTQRSNNEIAEEIDLLRWVENKQQVVAIDFETDMLSVDTKKDLDEVIRRIQKTGNE